MAAAFAAASHPFAPEVEPTPVTRFQKLAAATIVTTVLLVTIGVVVRATGSGMGCPDWPLCHNGVLPPLDDYQAWLEWIHRTVAAVIGFEILGLAFLAWLDHRDRRSILWPTLAAVLLVGLPGLARPRDRPAQQLGRVGDRAPRRGDGAARPAGVRVRAQLLPRRGSPAAARASGSRCSPTFTAIAIYALLLFGSPRHRDLAVVRVPRLAADERRRDPAPDRRQQRPRAPPLGRGRRRRHRVGDGARRVADAARRTRGSIRLALTTAVLFTVQAIVGGLQVLTGLAAWTQTLHLALGAVIWGLAAALAVVAYYEARTAVTAASGLPASGGRPGDDPGTRRRRREARRSTTGRRHRPRLHRADEAPDHRAAAGHDDPGDGPRDPRAARDERRRSGSGSRSGR